MQCLTCGTALQPAMRACPRCGSPAPLLPAGNDDPTIPADFGPFRESPYAGQQSRSIKALSEGDIAALQNGDGMGMAKAAELNGYPGPRHVLALAAELHLTEAQANQTNALYDRMSAAARPLGAELIERERLLDQLFAKGEITPERLTAETAAKMQAVAPAMKLAVVPGVGHAPELNEPEAVAAIDEFLDSLAH